MNDATTRPDTGSEGATTSETTGARIDDTEPEPAPTDLSRRTFLGATGAAVGAAAALPALVSVVIDDGARAALTGGPAGGDVVGRDGPAPVIDLTEPVVLHISDPAVGEVTVLVGEQRLVVIDPALVARIARAGT